MSSRILCPTGDFLQMNYKSQKFFFWFTSDAFHKRPVSSYQDSYVKFYKEIYKQKWYWKQTTLRVSGGVTHEYLKCLYRQTPLWLIVRSRSLRIPEEQVDHKKRDVEQSSPTHVRHTHCTPMQLGTTADRSMMFLGTDFEKHAIWQRVHWEARCEGFCSKEDLHFWLEWSVRNQLECDQVQRVLEKPSGSCLLTSNNQPISLVRKSLCNSSPRLYCVDFAEAYVLQENVCSRIFMRKGMICNCSTEVCMRNLCRERRNGERMPVHIFVPGSHERLTSRKCVMCARNIGAHVQHGIRSTKGKITG